MTLFPQFVPVEYTSIDEGNKWTAAKKKQKS